MFGSFFELENEEGRACSLRPQKPWPAPLLRYAPKSREGGQGHERRGSQRSYWDSRLCITTLSGAGGAALFTQVQWLSFEDVQLGKLFSCEFKTTDVTPSIKENCLQPTQHAFSQNGMEARRGSR